MNHYSQYKKTEIEWLEAIPINWTFFKLFYFVEKITNGFVGQTREIMQDSGIPYVQGIHIKNNTIEFTYNGFYYVSEDWSNEHSKSILRENDVLVVQTGSIGEVGIVPKELDGANCHALIILRTKKEIGIGKFLLWLLSSNFGYHSLYSIKTGDILLHLNTTRVKDIKIPLPSLKEQKQIADFLDQKTKQIDTLIEKKQKLIELLKEQRTAIINQAVTKGLDPNVPMKDSGIEWLGEIPEHWEIVKLNYLTTKIGSGVTPRGGAEVYQEKGIPLIRSQNIHFSGLKLEHVVFISISVHDSMSGSKVKENDVLINITGASIGRCFFVDKNLGEANVNQHVCIVRPNEKIKTEYLYQVLASYIGQFQVFINQAGTSREGLNFDQLKKFSLPLPPNSEQKRLIKFMRDNNELVFSSIKKIEKQINLLKEYRTTLISEVVTGKIDVRNEREKINEPFESTTN